MVEHDMGVVFGLADRITVLVYGEVHRLRRAGRHPRQCAPCRRPISAGLAQRAA
jgi:ABC-type glutathione transport system ATPase component